MLSADHPSSSLALTLVSEPLDGIAGERLRAKIRKYLQNGRRSHILDLRKLAELDSSTLATLIRVLRFVRAAGGSVGLIVDQENLLRIFSITALDRIFPIFHDEEAAKAALEMTDQIPA